uniref:U650o n=1 Tax=Mycobacterium leprae TaxID=1769 RepID=Q50107_MYCLR|nr:u650o [Mycobacterium leprae]
MTRDAKPLVTEITIVPMSVDHGMLPRLLAHLVHPSTTGVPSRYNDSSLPLS